MAWHVPFFFVQNIPEMLLQGKESQFWEFLLKASCHNPNSVSDELMAEFNERFVAPGGMRGILETYRAEMKNIHINQDLVAKGKVNIPLLTVGGAEFYGKTVKDHALKIFEAVEKDVVFDDCGHNLAIEKPNDLAKAIKEFMLNR